MKLRILPEAEAEVGDTAEWYEARRQGLGARFLLTIDTGFARVVSNPEAFPLWRHGRPHRKCVVDTFPYAIFFRVEAEEIVVVAVAHARRRPAYWAGR